MFGHDNHDDNNQDNSQVTHPTEPVADGSLSLPDDLAAAHDQATSAPAPEPTSSPSIASDAGSYIASDNGVPPTATTPSPAAVPAGSDDLVNIKQQALQQLSPLIGHLDQSPEEKFRTTMMMIQASDNQALIKEAYEAAQQITDEKVRAQALLDIVNEINYFTQQANT